MTPEGRRVSRQPEGPGGAGGTKQWGQHVGAPQCQPCLWVSPQSPFSLELQPCHHVPSVPPAARTWPRLGRGLAVGLLHPRVGSGVGGCQGGPAWLTRKPEQRLAPVPGRLLSALAGTGNICSMRSWFAQTARKAACGRWLPVTGLLPPPRAPCAPQPRSWPGCASQAWGHVGTPLRGWSWV